jgi:MFS family permease
MGLVAAVVQGWLVGKLVRRTSERMLVVVGTLTLVAGFFWMPFVFRGGPLGMLAALGLEIAGQRLASPSLSSLISKTAPSDKHGEILGLSLSLSAGARFLGPTAGGLLQGQFDAKGYFGAAVCAAGAFGLASLAHRAPATEPEAQTVRLRRSG